MNPFSTRGFHISITHKVCLNGTILKLRKKRVGLMDLGHITYKESLGTALDK